MYVCVHAVVNPMMSHPQDHIFLRVLYIISSHGRFMALGLPHWCSTARQESDCTLPLRAWKAGKLRFYSVLMKPNIAEYDIYIYI